MAAVDFKDYKATFGSGLSEPAAWRVTNNLVLKNERVFVDLRDVEKIALGVVSARGNVSHRLVFKTATGSKKIYFGEGWRTQRNKSFHGFRDTILQRYAHYRPDGEVDLSGDAVSKLGNLVFALIALFGAGLIAYISWFSGDAETAAQTPTWLSFAFFSLLLYAGITRVLVTFRKPESPAETAATVDALASSGMSTAQKVNIGFVAVALTLMFGLLVLGPRISGYDRVTASDVGMAPQIQIGSKYWANPRLDVKPFNIVAVDTSLLGVESLPAVIIRRVAALEGQPVRDSALRSFVVPPGHVYVLADNEGAVLDSRDFGPVPAEAITAVLVRDCAGRGYDCGPLR